MPCNSEELSLFREIYTYLHLYISYHRLNERVFHYWSVVHLYIYKVGVQWLSGRVLDSRPRGRGFEPHRRRCVVSLSKNINPCLVLVQPRKTRLFITERFLMGRKESNQTKTKSIKYT